MYVVKVKNQNMRLVSIIACGDIVHIGQCGSGTIQDRNVLYINVFVMTDITCNSNTFLNARIYI